MKFFSKFASSSSRETYYQLLISEIELLDLLSYSDEAVDEVYAAQGVLHRNIVRFPLNWWLQVR